MAYCMGLHVAKHLGVHFRRNYTLIIVYYLNGSDNPKTKWKLHGKSVFQNVTQLLLLDHRQSLLCTIIQKLHVISHRHLTE